MLRLNVYLCMLLLVLGIAVQFGDCQDNICEKDVEPGSEETHLSFVERYIKRYLLPVGNKIDHIIDRIRGKKNINAEEPEKTSFSNVLQKLKDFKLIFPGTKWCGDGDIARDDNDLGIFDRTDACCRAHDNCHNNIDAGKTRGNLKNIGIFTRSVCMCDEQFYQCLKNNTKSIVSFKIGTTYFNLLRPQCFQCVCPTKDCKESNVTECNDAFCTRYEWKDNPMF